MKTKKQQTILKGVNTTKAAECHRLKGGESPISSSKSWGGLITPSTTSLKWWIPSTQRSMSEFATLNWATARSKLKARKTTRRGGWIVFLETSSFTFWRIVLRFRVWSSSKSEWVQSLCAADKCKEQKKKEHKQLYRFLPQTKSSPVPLALPRRVPLKCNLKLQVAQSHKKETYLCSRTTPRDFYAQSHLKVTSMLKDNSKRLNLTITKNWIRFWILDIQSEVFTIQYETEQTLFF